MLRSVSTGLLFLALSLSAAAQSVTIGALPNNPAGSMTIGEVKTIIDFAHPAKVSGRVNYASLKWTMTPGTECKDAYSLKILRPDIAHPAILNVVDVIGPFDAHDGYNNVILSGNDIEIGDLLGVTVLTTDPDCGTVSVATGDASAALYVALEDVTTKVDMYDMQSIRWGTVMARLTNEIETLDGIITVAGSAAGAFGSNFRTSVQMTNPDWENPLQGVLYFRPAAGGETKKLEYELAPGQTIVYNDLPAEMGVTGLGSVDVRTIFSAIPVISTRVFNDLGTGGTLGFNEPIQYPGDVLGDDEFGYFITPSDFTNFHMNVGVRALDAGAKIFIAHLGSDGNSVGEYVVREYAPNSFTQVPLATFLQTTPAANGQVLVRVEGGGGAIIYTSTTDNRTNDSSISFVTRGR